jgi:hypothetical protein
MKRRTPGRATRQILSGAQLAPPREVPGGSGSDGEPVSFVFLYLFALAALIIASAIVWAIWGMGAASGILLVLAIGLIASWLVL